MSEARGHSLALERIGHSFGATIALEDVDLSVLAGELIALLGPSGCGKTTMLQIIAGFLRPTKGEVKFDGARVEHIPANRRRIGMVSRRRSIRSGCPSVATSRARPIVMVSMAAFEAA